MQNLDKKNKDPNQMLERYLLPYLKEFEIPEEIENKWLLLAYELSFQNKKISAELAKIKKPAKRGRPKKPKNQRSFGSILIEAIKKSKGKGRPKKFTIEEMKEFLNDWDSSRENKAQELNLEFLSDKNFLDELIQQPNRIGDKKFIRNRIKYMRDQTGIRQKQKNKK